MADYCTAAQLKGAGRLNISGNEYDTNLAEMVTVASRWIDRETWGITDAFKATATTTRYFWPDAVRGQALRVDKPLLSVSTLTNGDETELAASAYWLLPRNQTPYWSIKLKSSYAWRFVADEEIAVEGVWGYSAEVPEQVEEAALILAGWLFKRWQQALQDRSANLELGQLVYNAALPATVRELLRHVSQGPTL